jgi:CDP-diacylglycerol--serine O-phosphatidyltransferase
MTKTTTEIGVQLDSIADVVTFGVAPAVMVYAWGYGSALTESHQLHKVGLLISFIYLMCGGFRLARFNVQATRPRVLVEGAAKLDKKNFVGLPIPAAAGLIAAIIHYTPTPLLSFSGGASEIYSGLMMALVAALSALMVSTIRYTSFKSAGHNQTSPRIMLLAIAALGMLVWLYSRPALLILAGAYVAHGLFFRVLSLFRRSSTSESQS